MPCRAVRGAIPGWLLILGAATLMGHGPAVAQPRGSAVPAEPTAAPEQREPASQAQADPVPAEQEQRYNTDYRTRCERPQGHEEADLCQQWRSAQAAERSAATTERQFWVSIIESGALLVSIFFTAWAAVAASRAAQSADRAVEVAREANELNKSAYVTDQRPWVFHTEVVPTKVFDQNGKVVGYEFMIGWANAGRSPAIGCRCWGGSMTHHQNFDVEALEFPRPGNDVGGATSAPGVPFHGPPHFITIDNLALAAVGRGHIFIWGHVE